MILDAGGKALNRTDPSPHPQKKKLPTLMELIFWCGVERQTI